MQTMMTKWCLGLLAGVLLMGCDEGASEDSDSDSDQLRAFYEEDLDGSLAGCPSCSAWAIDTNGSPPQILMTVERNLAYRALKSDQDAEIVFVLPGGRIAFPLHTSNFLATCDSKDLLSCRAQFSYEDGAYEVEGETKVSLSSLSDDVVDVLTEQLATTGFAKITTHFVANGVIPDSTLTLAIPRVRAGGPSPSEAPLQ